VPFYRHIVKDFSCEQELIFRQLKQIGDNFSYVVADDITKEAVVVDPSFNADVIIEFLRDYELRTKYVIATHHHGDHTAEIKRIKIFSGASIVAHRLSTIDRDIEVADGDILELGNLCIKVIYTPGHTRDGICLLIDGNWGHTFRWRMRKDRSTR
jgi:glyoxylase-like metal-dependent hydrolase (beta-lactamase superfamily II)